MKSNVTFASITFSIQLCITVLESVGDSLREGGTQHPKKDVEGTGYSRLLRGFLRAKCLCGPSVGLFAGDLTPGSFLPLLPHGCCVFCAVTRSVSLRPWETSTRLSSRGHWPLLPWTSLAPISPQPWTPSSPAVSAPPGPASTAVMLAMLSLITRPTASSWKLRQQTWGEWAGRFICLFWGEEE